MKGEKDRFCIRFFVEPSDTEIRGYLKDIPDNHRSWEVKRIFLNSIKGKSENKKESPPSQEPEQRITISSTTPKKISTDF